MSLQIYSSVTKKVQENLANKLKNLPIPQTCDESIDYLNDNIIGNLKW